MTQLEANLKDFHVERDAEDEIEAWRFRFGSCEDFHDTMSQFKKKIAFEDRTPNPEANWLWTVTATAKNRGSMEEIFDNFEQCLNIAESQMRMFGG